MTSEANTRSVKKKNFNHSGEELKGRFVTVFGKLVCFMGRTSTGPDIWLANALLFASSLKHRDLTLLITYGKLALTRFCAVEYGKEGKISKWSCSEWGCGKGRSPRGAETPELGMEHTGYKQRDCRSSNCVMKEAALKNQPNLTCLCSLPEDSHPLLSDC